MYYIPHQRDQTVECGWVAVTEIGGDVEEFVAVDEFDEGCVGGLGEGGAVCDAGDSLDDTGMALGGLGVGEGCGGGEGEGKEEGSQGQEEA